MSISNQSRRHGIWQISLLLEFICKRTKHHDRASLYLCDNRPGKLTGGLAWRYKVELHLSRGTGRYPRKTWHVAEVGTVELWSWEEEVLFVLAHELAHVDDFNSGRMARMTVHQAEVRAEKFALRTLKAFRKAGATR